MTNTWFYELNDDLFNDIIRLKNAIKLFTTFIDFGRQCPPSLAWTECRLTLRSYSRYYMELNGKKLGSLSLRYFLEEDNSKRTLIYQKTNIFVCTECEKNLSFQQFHFLKP